jgi:2-polyprenyl-3-methyl-5-hydroxy-6-metoxy-1,4-benzoquinol methylase
VLVSVTSEPVINGLRTALVGPDSWEELNACPICNENEYIRDVAIVEGEFTASVTSVCLDCEFGFKRRRPTEEWFNRFYSADWDEHGQSLSRSGLSVRPKGKVVAFCNSHLTEASRVLEVGAGFGGFLLAFKRQGHDVFGVERSQHRAAYVNDVLGIPCVHSPIETAKLPHRFDLIYMNHVLEHVSDPSEVIRLLRAKLSDAGMVYQAVPDFWQEYPPQIFHFIPHLSLFTAKSIERLFIKNGFKVVKAEVDNEIQLLTVKTDAPVESAGSSQASRSMFWDKVVNYIRRSFGGGGKRTLVWCKSGGPSYFRSWTFPGWALIPALTRLGFATSNMLPQSVAYHALPEFLHVQRPRMLTVNMSDGDGLPLSIKHARDEQAVWVK